MSVYEFINLVELVESLLSRHPGESRITSGTGAGVQKFLISLDSGFRRNDGKVRFPSFYEAINLDGFVKSLLSCHSRARPPQ